MNKMLIAVAAMGAAALGYYSYDAEVFDPIFRSKPMASHSARVKKQRASQAAAQEASVAAAAEVAAAEQAVPSAPVAPAAEPSATPEPAALAAEPAAAPQEKADADKMAAPGSARVADVLATLPLVKDCTPNAEARYYIYLLSAGWCGPCNREMPNIVKAYEEMQDSGVVELILVDFDSKPEQARAYMDKYGATFPAIMQENGSALPGIQPPAGIPTAHIVDAVGNPVASGHGAIATQWKKLIGEYEQREGLPLSLEDELAAEDTPAAAEAEDAAPSDKADKKVKKPRSNVVARSLGKVRWDGRPNKKAQYYIYLQSASWCGPCQAEMPHIAAEYKEMKKDGRVELLLISFDRSEEAARKFLKSHKAEFPMALRTAKGVKSLAGFTMAQGIPHAIIVDASGAVVTQGHGSLVKSWRQFTIERSTGE